MLKFAALRPSQSPLFVLKFDLLLATCTSPTTLNSQASSLIYRHNRGRTHISAEGQAYRDNVARIIKNAMLDIGLAIPVKIRIECHMPDRRRRDLDNLQKAAFDALTKAGFWLDDVQVVDYRVVKMPVNRADRQYTGGNRS